MHIFFSDFLLSIQTAGDLHGLSHVVTCTMLKGSVHYLPCPAHILVKPHHHKFKKQRGKFVCFFIIILRYYRARKWKTLHIWLTSITGGDLQDLPHNVVTWPMLTHIADDLLCPLCTYYLYLLLEQLGDHILAIMFIELYCCVYLHIYITSIYPQLLVDNLIRLLHDPCQQGAHKIYALHVNFLFRYKATW